MIIDIVFQVEYVKQKDSNRSLIVFVCLQTVCASTKKHDLEADLKRQTITILIGNTVKPRQ